MTIRLRAISLGAGVQSSTAALLAKHGEITPMPDCGIFADTEDEPHFTKTFDPTTNRWIEGGVYGWLDWLERQLPFPVYRVSRGNLMKDSQRIARSKKSGKLYMKGNIPAFVLGPDGSKGILGRKCTNDYKIVPIQKKVRELLGVKRGGKTVLCEMLIGISMDEAIRMKPSRKPYIRNIYPLIDLRMSRKDCLNWMLRNNYPIPPRSACVSCPFHGDKEWKHLKENAPEDFASAVETERQFQAAAARQNALNGIPFLHSSCRPLDDVDFDANPHAGQLDLFMNECEGLCGV